MSNLKKINQRRESNKRYIDALQENNSKINVVRIDLAYTSEYSNDIRLEQANKDLNRLLNNRRSKPKIFEHNIGYICKKEYTEDKGVHFHTFFMFDGQKVKQSSNKAKEIGDYWNEQITKSKGSYHNCHRNKYKYDGIGMINHKDTEKRENLDKAIDYLCKDDHQDIAPVQENKNNRAFVRSAIPKKKSKAGRPRKESK